MDVEKHVERINKLLVDVRLDVIKRSDVNPMSHVCEVEADQASELLFLVGLQTDSMLSLNNKYWEAQWLIGLYHGRSR